MSGEGFGGKFPKRKTRDGWWFTGKKGGRSRAFGLLSFLGWERLRLKKGSHCSGWAENMGQNGHSWRCEIPKGRGGRDKGLGEKGDVPVH